MAGVNLSASGLKAWWDALSKRDKWLIGGGGVLVVLLAITEAGAGGRPDTYAAQPVLRVGGPGYYGGQGGGQMQGYADQGEAAYYGQGGGQQQMQGYYQGGYAGGAAPSYAAGSTGGGDSDPTGYWAQQRANDQMSQARENAMLDMNTIQNNDTGTVYSGVDNSVADPAIASGSYSEVPTSELPTTYDSSSSSSGE